MQIFRALTTAIVGTAMMAASPLYAHTRLVSSNPGANATVSAGPKTITLTFSEQVIPSFSKVELTMPADGTKIPVKSAVSPDGKRLVGTLSSALKKGSYKVAWTAASTDGHKMNGTISFKVA